MSETLSFAVVSTELLAAIDTALPILTSMSEPDSARPLAPGKWSAKQVIGHLIDSAANNHQRFVRAQDGALVMPGYAQDAWVGRQDYQARGWLDLVGLWHAYNRHLAHVIARIPADRQNVSCTIGDDPPETLGFIAQNYVAHLHHHLAQVHASKG